MRFCNACSSQGGRFCTVNGVKNCNLTKNRIKPLAENYDAWDLWQASQSCFEVGMAGITGLRYGDVKAVAEALDIEWTEDLLRRIRMLEIDYMEQVNRK